MGASLLSVIQTLYTCILVYTVNAHLSGFSMMRVMYIKRGHFVCIEHLTESYDNFSFIFFFCFILTELFTNLYCNSFNKVRPCVDKFHQNSCLENCCMMLQKCAELGKDELSNGLSIWLHPCKSLNMKYCIFLSEDSSS